VPDIFLSYSREDQATARRYAEALQREGFNVWWDQALDAGEDFDEVTERALEEAKAVVVLWSRTSVSSRWVRAEATQANAANKLVPVMIEDCKRPIMFELKQTVDLSGWSGNVTDAAWQGLLAGLRRRTGGGEVGGQSVRSAPAAPKRGLPRSLWVAAVAVVALAAIGTLVWRFGTGGRTSAAGADPVAAQPQLVTLAVLPFVNLSADPDQEYFSDGLAEEILDQLAQNKEMRVTARTSSFAFKGQNVDVREIGAKLGVGNLLEGSVRKEGDRIRITAQLIDATSGTHRWSQSYERDLTDVFALQEEVARAVAQALSITLDAGEASRSRGGTTSIEAYDKYLRARALERQATGSEYLRKAVGLYREAVAIDPAFVNAWRSLYLNLGGLTIYGTETQANTLLAERNEIVSRLVELAPGSWQTQATLMNQLLGQRKWLEAEAAVAKARVDFPGIRWGGPEGAAGQISEQVPLVERERDADPLSLATSFSMQLTYYFAGRLADAWKQFQRSKSLEGDHENSDIHAIYILQAMQDPDPALLRAQRDRYLQLLGTSHRGMRIFLEQLQRNDLPAARTSLHKLFDDPEEQNPFDMITIAMFADYLGDKDLALSASRKGWVDMKGGNLIFIWMPSRSGFRSDPRFKDLARDLGFVDYWRGTGKWGDFCKPVGKDDFECH
jgi:TolB-like protein